VAGRLAGDEKPDRLGAAVDGPMHLARGNLQALVRAERVGLVAQDEGKFAGEDIEELARVDVVVRGLGCARRHKLLDDVELRRAHEIPGV